MGRTNPFQSHFLWLCHSRVPNFGHSSGTFVIYTRNAFTPNAFTDMDMHFASLKFRGKICDEEEYHKQGASKKNLINKSMRPFIWLLTPDPSNGNVYMINPYT